MSASVRWEKRILVLWANCSNQGALNLVLINAGNSSAEKPPSKNS